MLAPLSALARLESDLSLAGMGSGFAVCRLRRWADLGFCKGSYHVVAGVSALRAVRLYADGAVRQAPGCCPEGKTLAAGAPPGGRSAEKQRAAFPAEPVPETVPKLCLRHFQDRFRCDHRLGLDRGRRNLQLHPGLDPAVSDPAPEKTGNNCETVEVLPILRCSDPTDAPDPYRHRISDGQLAPGGGIRRDHSARARSGNTG